MIKEVENIILNKSYDELSAEELEAVHELVSNAEEYEEMKWFLASTQQALAADKIKATPELRKSVMDHLHRNESERKFWLNSLVGFLFPEDKEFYKKPAFQLSMAALLVIGFLFIYNPPMQEDSLAINDTVDPILEPTKEEISDPNAPKQDKSTNEFMDHTVVEDQDEEDEITALDQLEKTELKELEESKDRANELSTAEGSGADDAESDWANFDGYFESEKTQNEESVEEVNVPATTGTTNSKNKVTQNGNRNIVSANNDEDKVLEDANQSDNRGVETEEAKKSERMNLFSRKENKKASRSDDAFATTAVKQEVRDSTDIGDKVTLGGAAPSEEQSETIIRPYSMHVNEAKELKQLFTTYK